MIVMVWIVISSVIISSIISTVISWFMLFKYIKLSTEQQLKLSLTKIKSNNSTPSKE